MTHWIVSFSISSSHIIFHPCILKFLRYCLHACVEYIHLAKRWLSQLIIFHDICSLCVWVCACVCLWVYCMWWVGKWVSNGSGSSNHSRLSHFVSACFFYATRNHQFETCRLSRVDAKWKQIQSGNSFHSSRRGLLLNAHHADIIYMPATLIMSEIPYLWCERCCTYSPITLRSSKNIMITRTVQSKAFCVRMGSNKGEKERKE